MVEEKSRPNDTTNFPSYLSTNRTRKKSYFICEILSHVQHQTMIRLTNGLLMFLFEILDNKIDREKECELFRMYKTAEDIDVIYLCYIESEEFSFDCLFD